MTVRFLDTNILLRYFTRDDEKKAAQTLSLLTRVESGAEKVVTSPLVLFEVVFTLERSYAVPKARVAELVFPILGLRGLKLPNKTLWRMALRLYVEHSLDFADAYNASYMHALGISEIYSWDTDFDTIPGITRRLEPAHDTQEAA